MASGLALLRTFGVLMISLAIGLSLLVNHVGRAAALSAAHAGAEAAAGSLKPEFDCGFDAVQAERAEEHAAKAVVKRLEQLSTATATELSVDLSPACEVVVGVTVAMSTWLPLPQPRAVVCHHGTALATEAVEALARC